MRYFHLIQGEESFQEQYYGPAYDEPWVSVTLSAETGADEDGNRVNYNKISETPEEFIDRLKDVPFTVKAKVDGTLVVGIRCLTYFGGD